MYRTTPEVIVIGAGITGLAAAYWLRKKEISCLILEARADLGGVWSTHRWHGARCDSDFVKYSFSFKPFLSERCLQGRKQIHAYLGSVAREFALLDDVRFNTQVHKAMFDPERQQWTVYSSRGRFTARFLVNGNGYFHDRPHVPAFQGLEQFRGEVVHTYHLDDSRAFSDKDVVLVGSGATAICCAPPLAEVSRSLVLLQRSPSYIYEIDDDAGRLTRLAQALHRSRVPGAVKLLRAYLQIRDDLIYVGFRRFPHLARWFFAHHWRQFTGDRSARPDFTPRYNPWEQRIPIAVGLKEKLRSGQIAIRTAGIRRFTKTGIVLTTGQSIPCDVCVLATGHDLRFFSFDLHVDGHQIPVERINFYKGLMVGGVPNYFHPLGSWHSAWTGRVESASRLAASIITHMRKQGLGAVSIARAEVTTAPGIKPNYVLRALSTLPRLHGITGLPSIDNVLGNRFNPRHYEFVEKAARRRSSLLNARAF